MTNADSSHSNYIMSIMNIRDKFRKLTLLVLIKPIDSVKTLNDAKL